jgi:hypothetical protein
MPLEAWSRSRYGGWTEHEGAAASPDPRQYLRAFHDKFLSYGGPPIPLVHKAMVGEGGALF